MKLLIDGKLITYSVHERPTGNASIKFRTEKGGKPFTVSSGVPRKRQVTTSVAEAAILRHLPKAAPGGSRGAISGGLDLRDEILAFLKDEYQYTVPEHTTTVRTILGEMAALCPSGKLESITREHFRGVIKPTMESGLAPKTWAAKLAYMRKFFRWEQERGNLGVDPSIGIKPPPKELFGTRDVVWEDEWYRAVRKELLHIPHLGKSLVELLDDYWFTGMDTKDIGTLRPKRDLIQLTVADVNGRPLTVWKVYKKRAKEHEIIDQPIHKEILPRWIKRYHECGPDDRLHETGHNSAKEMGRLLRDHIHRIQRRLGLPLVDLKSIRHTFATRWAKLYVTTRGRQGPPLDELRKWLGHAPGSRMLEKVYVKWQAWVSPEALGEDAFAPRYSAAGTRS